ncbi:hypothetical protein ABZ897_19350 [Nonomuraea sp. NPDC046802]|uniref:hypothetical protein n=1 Tax=Nonomuraea sp. NPDC046802 TaxID=3154919 RepID=UPI0033FDE9CC
MEVPVGNGAGHLTPNISNITAKGEYTNAQSVTVLRQGSNTFQATAPTGSRTRFAPGDHLVLTLENVTVASAAGLAVLKVTEKTGRSATGRMTNSVGAVALVKTAPKGIPAPSDFRAEKSMVEPGADVALLWNGSGDFDYKIVLPDGAEEAVGQNIFRWSPSPGNAPKRDTTYTLVATSRTAPTQQHFLTTAIQVRNPTLETVTADNAYFNTVTTPWIGGPNTGDGTMTFPQGGVIVWRTGGSQERGTISADKADLNGVNTEWVQGKSTDDGWISFPKDGLNVRKGPGQTWGTVFADKADLDGVNTRWVQGRSTDDGWIGFPKEGVRVYRAGIDAPGTVFTEFIQAKDAAYGYGGSWINLHEDGITVYLDKDGKRGFGSVTGSEMNSQGKHMDPL